MNPQLRDETDEIIRLTNVLVGNTTYDQREQTEALDEIVDNANSARNAIEDDLSRIEGADRI